MKMKMALTVIIVGYVLAGCFDAMSAEKYGTWTMRTALMGTIIVAVALMKLHSSALIVTVRSLWKKSVKSNTHATVLNALRNYFPNATDVEIITRIYYAQILEAKIIAQTVQRRCNMKKKKKRKKSLEARSTRSNSALPAVYNKFKASNVPPSFPHISLFNANTRNVFDMVAAILESSGKYKVTRDTGNLFLYGEAPKSPFLLVAHADTVHARPPHVLYDKDENVLWSKNGLGADDRAGIAAIIEIVKWAKNKDVRPSVLITDLEERGCIGARSAANEISPSEGNRLVIELDRRGRNDMVFYDCDNPDADAYVKKFGFEKNFGSMSDISVLCPAWGVAGVNLSIGYYDEHTFGEHLKLSEWENTVAKVKEMLLDPPGSKLEFIERDIASYYLTSKYCGYGYDYYDGYYDDCYEDRYNRLYTTISDDLKLSVSYDYLVDEYGGYRYEWREWMKAHKFVLQKRMLEASHNAIEQYLFDNLPDFLFQERGDDLK